MSYEEALIAEAHAWTREPELSMLPIRLLEVVTHLADALSAALVREQTAKAEAWDEGYCAVPAEPEDREWFVEDAPNPYRKES